MLDDTEIPNRWFLQSPSDRNGTPIDPELFRIGKSVTAKGPLSISVRRSGAALGWTFADLDMPVATRSIADIMREIAPQNLEIHPSSVEGF